MLTNPLSWSLPLGRVFGITVRVHVLFVVVFFGLILHHALGKPQQEAAKGEWIDMAVILTLLFLSVLLHEFGHCFGARSVDGDADEILLWPLGGLAFTQLPQTARAHFVTAVCGPLVNVVLAAASGAALVLLFDCWPPLTIGAPVRPLAEASAGLIGPLKLFAWSGAETYHVLQAPGGVLLAWLFWVNYLLALLNLVLIGYPMDGGRILQAILWRYVGYRQAMLTAVFAGFVTMFVVGLFAIAMDSTIAFMLATMIFLCCRHEYVVLETGGEEGLFGYDFSQGYTSLEREQGAAAPGTAPRRRANWWQRWQQRRAARRMQQDLEVREAEERRMDELLEKVQRDGITALSEEEKRFLKRVSDRYRNRQ